MTRKEQIEKEAQERYPHAVQKVRDTFIEGAQFADNSNKLSMLIIKLLYNSREFADDYHGTFNNIKDEILDYLKLLNNDLIKDNLGDNASKTYKNNLFED